VLPFALIGQVDVIESPVNDLELFFLQRWHAIWGAADIRIRMLVYLRSGYLFRLVLSHYRSVEVDAERARPPTLIAR